MGVSDLNKLISLAKPTKRFDYKYVMIDMSNMIVTYLFRWFSRLPSTKEIKFDNYTVKSVKGGGIIVENIEKIMTDLRSEVVGDISEIVIKLNKIYPGLEKIVFVSDPTTVYNYRYLYNDEKHMSCVDNDLFNVWVTLNGHKIDDYDDISIDFSSKEEERSARVKSQMTKHPIQILDKDGNVVREITDYRQFKEEPEDEELKHIFHVMFTCTYFMRRVRLMRLISYIQDGIISLAETTSRIEYLCSKGEADIFIKAYHNKYLNDGTHTLVMSNDTDYFMLFADVPSVDVSKLSPFNPQECSNPNEFWSDMLQIHDDPKFMRLMIARLSALFGNDYTCHRRKVVVDPAKFDAVKCLFNINDYEDIHELSISKVSSLYKLQTGIDSIYEDTHKYVTDLYDKWQEKSDSKVRYKTYQYNRAFKHIDTALVNEAVRTKDNHFFNGYYETLLIYMNFDTYDEFTDMKGKCLSSELQKRIKNEIKYTIDFDDKCKEIKV